MSEANEVVAQLKYKGVEKTFIGKPEEVWLSINKFFTEFLPSFKIAEKITLKVDLQKLVNDCNDMIAFSPEGPNLLISKNKLTDNEALTLWLLANHTGFQLGKLKSDAASKEELQTKLGKSPKIVSTRLGELVKNDIAAKTTDEKYRITTFGIVQMQKETLPKIRAKLSN